VSSGMMILRNDCFLKDSNEAWVARSCFPDMEKDLLLYLFLMGGPHRPAFAASNRNRVSYAYFLDDLKKSNQFRSHQLAVDNAIQTSTSGMDLEATLATVVCLASHARGLEGISVGDFVYEIAFELGRVSSSAGDTLSNSSLRESIGKLFGECANRHIPYLSPPNQPWPTVLKSQNWKIANLKRCKNEEEIDLSTDVGISGEAKDYGDAISSATMRNILIRVPATSFLHIVLCRALQQKYFNKRGYDADVLPHISSTLECVALNLSADIPVLSHIDGLPRLDGTKSNRIVLFVCAPR
jgi:hypothetical protein